MTEDSRTLLDLAKHNVRVFPEMSGARAALVSGSVAEGRSDSYSDIDMMDYYDAAAHPSIVTLATTRPSSVQP